MLFYTTLLYVIIIITNECSAWTIGPSQLPRLDTAVAIGYDDINDTILLVGGNDYDQQFVTFKDHQFIDLGEDYISYSFRTYGYGQYYTQLGDDLWVMSAYKDLITINTHSYAATDPSIGFSSFGVGGCLTSTMITPSPTSTPRGYLFIIPGALNCGELGYVDPTIYDLYFGVWTSVAPLDTIRRFEGCAAVADKLFVIGGENSTCDALDSIEILDISDLPSTQTMTSWSYNQYSLSTARSGAAVAVHGKYIFVIGGDPGQEYPISTYRLHYELEVNVINSVSGYCSVHSTMDHDTVYASAIVANNVLFAFGGGSFSTYYRSYQYQAIGPTNAPTPKPTSSPSLVPSRSPTKAPSMSTSTPSIPPTYNPTMMPSVTPTKQPTTPPSIPPTIMPSVVSVPPTQTPTIIPTKVPSNIPSKTPIKEETDDHDEDADFESIQYERLDSLAMIHQFVFGGFICGVILISLFAWMDAKCRKNDYLRITFVVGISLQTMDMFSDCFFAVNMGIWRNINPMYTYVLLLSIAFVVVPCAFTIVQLLLHSRKHWFNSSDKVRGWLANRSNMLYFASIITGSSFAAVSLCNSYMFQWDAFDMGLTRKEIQAFMYKRVYSVVFLENIPQLAMQSYFVYTLGTLDDLVTMSSMLFSLLSIIVSILSMFTQRSISRGQGTVSISMEVTGSAVVAKASKCKRMKNALIKELSILVGVSRSTTDILRPLPIIQGFIVTVVFTVSDSDKEFYRTLMDAQKKGELQSIFKRSWDLSDLPLVSDLKQTVKQSKRERLGSSESMSDGKGRKTGTDQTDVVNDIYGVEITYAKDENTPWNCSNCTYSNNASSNRCEMCTHPKN